MAKKDPYDCIKAALDADLINEDEYAAAIQEVERYAWVEARMQETDLFSARLKAGKKWAKELAREKRLVEYRAKRQALINNKNAGIVFGYKRGVVEGTMMLMDRAFYGKTDILGEVQKDLHEFFDTIRSKFFTLKQRQDIEANFLYELSGRETDDLVAKKGAKAWTKATDRLLELAEAEGLPADRLGDYLFPQRWSETKMFAVGEKQWVNDAIDHLDFTRYKDMTRRQVIEEVLIAGYRNPRGLLGTQASKNPKATGATTIARHRRLHWKSIDDRLFMMERYSDGNLLGQLTAHMENVAGEISNARTFGTNPRAGFNSIKKQFFKADEESRTDGGDGLPNSHLGIKFFSQGEQHAAGNAMFNVLSGEANQVESVMVAGGMQAVRNAATAARLGGAVLSALVDPAFLAVGARYNKVGGVRLARSMIRYASSKEYRQQVSRLGQVFDALNPGNVSNFRGIADFDGATFLSRMAYAVIQGTGLINWTDGLRAVYGMEMMGRMETERLLQWGQLTSRRKVQFGRAGISEVDWNQIRQADSFKLEGEDGGFLTPDSIRRLSDKSGVSTIDARELAVKYRMFLEVEKNRGVPYADLRSQTVGTGGYRKGTFYGEATRAFSQFKQFPVSVLLHQIGRTSELMEAEGVGHAAAYLGGTMVATTLMGALSKTIKDTFRGYEPQSWDDPKFWAAAMAQGGGWGIAGDFLYHRVTQRGHTKLATAAGPAGNLAEDVWSVAYPQNWDDRWGERVVSLFENWTPGSNIFFIRPVLEFWVFDTLDALVSPDSWRKKRREKMRYQERNYERGYLSEKLQPYAGAEALDLE